MANTNSEIASDWRARVAVVETWRPSRSSALVRRGRCHGGTYTFDGLGRNAYVKPLQARNDLRLSAAKEKIASDLAHDLGVPVPPVVLAPHVENAPPMCRCSASLVMRDRQVQLRLVSTTQELGDPILEAVPRLSEVVSGLLVFNTWIGQFDHIDGDPQGNLVFGYDLDDSGAYTDVELIALDYEGAFPTNSAAKRPRSFPSEFASRLSRQAVEAAISRVENYDSTELNVLVNRLPGEYLPPDAACSLREGLMRRRETLRQAFSDLLEGGTP